MTVQVPEGAFDSGTKVRITKQTVPKESADFLVDPVVDVDSATDRPPTKPVTLRFPRPGQGEVVSIAYLDPDSHWWLPVQTTTDPSTGEQVASVDHLSRWGRIRNKLIDLASHAPNVVQTSASWLEYQSFRLLGNRATRPHCDGALPSWVAGDLIVNEDNNAELFACGYTVGDDAVLKLANNRGYPVTVEFSHPFKSSSTDLPTSLGDVVQRISNPGSSTRVFLVGQGSGTVTFSRPTKPANGVVEGHVRRDGGTMLANVVFDLLSMTGADLPVGGGKTLGLSSIECVASQPGAVGGTAEGIRTTDAGKVGEALGGLRGCMNEVVGTELARAVPNSDVAKKLGAASKFLKALAVWDLTQQAADAFINDSTPEAELVDVSFRWKLPSQSSAQTSVVKNACGLLTSAEIERTLGKKVGDGQPFTNVDHPACNWALPGTPRSNHGGEASFDATYDTRPDSSSASYCKNGTLEKGIGDGYRFSLTDNYREICVIVGSRTFNLSRYDMAASDPAGDSGDQELVRLARLAIERLPTA